MARGLCSRCRRPERYRHRTQSSASSLRTSSVDSLSEGSLPDIRAASSGTCWRGMPFAPRASAQPTAEEQDEHDDEDDSEDTARAVAPVLSVCPARDAT